MLTFISGKIVESIPRISTVLLFKAILVEVDVSVLSKGLDVDCACILDVISILMTNKATKRLSTHLILLATLNTMEGLLRASTDKSFARLLIGKTISNIKLFFRRCWPQESFQKPEDKRYQAIPTLVILAAARKIVIHLQMIGDHNPRSSPTWP
ncbi:MAG: hypothetical protein ACE14P_04640 [Methanotrichaceae archaeon]